MFAFSTLHLPIQVFINFDHLLLVTPYYVLFPADVNEYKRMRRVLSKKTKEQILNEYKILKMVRVPR